MINGDSSYHDLDVDSDGAFAVGGDGAGVRSFGYSLLLQKYFRFDARLFKDGAQRSFWHIAGMIGDRGVAIRSRVVPDFMATRGLAMELKAERF